MNEKVMQVVDGLAVTTQTVLSWFVNMVWNNPEITKIGMSAAALVTVMLAMYVVVVAVRWLLRKAMAGYREISFRVRRAWHRLRKRPMIRAVEGKFMAKWKNGMVADKIGDAIFDLEMAGVLSEQEAARATKKVAKALGLYDLMPRRFHKLWLRHYFLGSKTKDGKDVPPVYQKMAGPKKPIPGPKPGEDVPVAPSGGNVVASDMLNRIRAKKQAQAA